MSLTAPRVAVVRPVPVALTDFTDVRRQSTRPAAFCDADYDAKFDAETLFYDAFLGIDRRIVLAGPPFLNLKADLERMTLTAHPSGVACPFELREMDRHGQVHVSAPDGTTALTLACAFGTTEIAIQPSEADLFAGRRVVFTQSKNNHLQWIQDWVRFSRDIHGADAVLIYDNSSTHYTPHQLADAIGALDGIAVVRIVDWPFKFGPQGLDAHRFWDSDFGQHGVWEHGRRRFLEAAASVQCSDVDEFVLAPDGRSIFEAVEAEPFGVLRYEGRWVIGIEGRDPLPGRPDLRHIDYTVTRRERIVSKLGLLKRDADRCPPKWTVVPAKCPDRAQWRIHAIGGHAPSRLMTKRFSYRHFREISDSWKYERGGREGFDPVRHEEDALLARHVAAVRWDA